jgi:hypothetical protein
MAFNFSFHLTQVYDLDVTPVFLKVIRNQPTMAVVRFLFAAEKTAIRDEVALDLLFDPPFLHQIQKLTFVGFPRSMVLLVGVEHFLRGRQKRQVDVANPVNLSKKVGEISLFYEAGLLRHIVES